MPSIKQVALRTITGVGAPLVAVAHTGRRRREGLAAPTTRAAFLRQVPLASALEIGPFNNPTIAGPGVSYFDVLDAAALRTRAVAIGYDAERIPARIDYVSPVGDLDVVDRRFDAVLSSHAVEHQPDLIGHLKKVARLIEPGGSYFLIIPDRRYTFDQSRPETQLSDVEAAHRERRRVHTGESIRATRLQTTHNNPLRHWLGRHGAPAPDAALVAAANDEARRAAGGEYIDVHAWTFSPESFRRIIAATSAATGLSPAVVRDTAFGDLEFFAVLRKTA
ncbi:SAM-dependent methyltransferase [Sphingomonas jinjuensis]|uniref:SAM-dependent methyltransferase n=1 Tax=Sphingomonas jinjuensis TaxID=535907 RepID=A0A840FHE0_9SPHN|nr:methyltransferase domain-containing protein [Sphingomonas jinjuensis]MBB4155134.1 SAM-dependent methyltransferase [Sphingomonas jinjuensis]